MSDSILYIKNLKKMSFKYFLKFFKDNADLDRLEERLRIAELDINRAELDTRLRGLTLAKNLQTQWVKNYEDEVSRLRLEVENINEIKNALPRECFKKIVLEP